MEIERYRELTDDQLKRCIADNKRKAEEYRALANRLYIQSGNYSVELDRRAVERLGLSVGDKVLKADRAVSVIRRIGNWGGGLDYIIVDIDDDVLSVKDAKAMRDAYLASKE